MIISANSTVAPSERKTTFPVYFSPSIKWHWVKLFEGSYIFVHSYRKLDVFYHWYYSGDFVECKRVSLQEYFSIDKR